MEPLTKTADTFGHAHVFLGSGHQQNERKTWGVIVLCGVMMVVEIVGGSVFGSLALVADGLHMSTHAGAMLIAALAYTYARRHAEDSRFVFGTGKLGDLAGFTSAIVLALIALLIGYEAVLRLLSPVVIHFEEAIPIAAVGLLVNVASAWLLSGPDHVQGHGHGGHEHWEHASGGHHAQGHGHDAHDHDHDHDQDRGHGHDDHDHDHDHDHGHHHAIHRDNSIRSAYVHVMADAAVSVVAIVGLILARTYGWLWMDPVAGIVGALVIANWAYRLLRDTAGILLDVCPDDATREKVRAAIESDGDRVVDLHMWRLGPGHLGAVVEVVTSKPHDAAYYRAQLHRFRSLSHITVEVTRRSS